MNKKNILGLSLSELTELALENGLKRFAGAQLSQWIYQKRASDFSEMTNIPAKAREELSTKYNVGKKDPINIERSVDGTKKYLFETISSNLVEAVYIPADDRDTLCISSQSGCKMGCEFCMTARMGFREHLTAGEIINQFISVDESEKLTNIVYMGMGEPLDNIDNVLKSIEIMTSSWGYGWSPTRITLSTIGILPALERFLNETKANLAISLHSPFDKEREKLMPVQKAYPISEVIDMLKKYDFSGHRRLSFEYIMFDGINDTQKYVNEIIRLLKGIRCGVNLIPFHQIPDSELRPSSKDKIEWFNRELNRGGIKTTTRSSRGEDISAACGMLAAKS